MRLRRRTTRLAASNRCEPCNCLATKVFRPNRPKIPRHEILPLCSREAFPQPQGGHLRHLHSFGQCGHQGASSFGQAGQVDLLTVGLAIFPTTVKDTHPFERQGAHCGVVFLAAGFLLLIVGFGPLALGNRTTRPFMECLAQKLRTGPSEMYPFAVAARFFDGRDTAKAVQFVGRSIAIALGSQGPPSVGVPEPHLLRERIGKCASPPVWPRARRYVFPAAGWSPAALRSAAPRPPPGKEPNPSGRGRRWLEWPAGSG